MKIATHTSQKISDKNLYLLCVLVVSCFFSHTPLVLARVNNLELIRQFENINLKQGLSQSTVKGIVQDPNGFIWLATYDGLNRYDGYQFRVYRANSSVENSLASNFLTTLAFSDEMIWIGTLDAGLSSFDPKNNQFTRYQLVTSDDTVSSTSTITTLFTTSQGHLLIGTKKLGAFIKLSGENKITPVRIDHVEFAAENSWGVTTFSQTSKDILWIASPQLGLVSFDLKTMQLKNLRLRNEKISLSGEQIMYITSGQNSLLIALKDQGVYKIGFDDQGANNSVSLVLSIVKSKALKSAITSLLMDTSNNRLLIGTETKGVIVLDLLTKRISSFKKSKYESSGISDNFIHSLYIDRGKVLWIGTDNGLAKYSVLNNRFNHWKLMQENSKDSFNQNMIWSIKSLQDYVLIGSQIGLNVVAKDFYGSKTKISTSKLTSDFEGIVVNDIDISNKGEYWFATSQGLMIVNTLMFSKDASKNNSFDLRTLMDSYVINTQYHDTNDLIWIGTKNNGVFLLNEDKLVIKHLLNSNSNLASLSSNNIVDIFRDRNANLWILTAQGLNKQIENGDQFQRYQFSRTNPLSISNDFLTSVYQTTLGVLWFGTADGLNKYTPSTDSFQRYSINDGLPNNQISSIIEDKQQNLWISTTNGLTMFNPRNNTFKNYFESDGLQSNEFNRGAVSRSDDFLLMGGINGFNRFDPNLLVHDEIEPSISLTNVLLFNKPITEKRTLEKPIFQGSVSSTKSMLFEYDDKMITFEFAALHYSDPQKSQYKYYLQGYDKTWIYTDSSKRFATYTSLPPGDYQFKIKAANKDGVWNHQPSKVRITMLPPWWQTWWAYCLYSIIVLSILYIYNRTQKLKLITERNHIQKLLELDRIKDDFLAKTSHELRTPLNGIIGLSDSLISGVTGNLSDTTKENLEIISSSGKRLAKLVNDILDFSQLKHDGIQLEKKKMHLAPLVDVIITLCKPLVNDKKVKITSKIPVGLDVFYADQARIEQILINLISNAITHTTQGEIIISAQVENQFISVSVSDTGSGIPQQHIQNLFESFSQFTDNQENLQTGVGLGLTITKHLVELHGGKITAKNVGKGACFTFTLPIGQPSEKNLLQPISETQVVKSNVLLHQKNEGVRKQHIAGSQQKILIADDEQVNCKVVANFLTEKKYDITIVSNGEEVMQSVAIDGPFDLIILDVVMPILSGYEVCKLIRKKQNYFELPILMLSAKTQPNDIVVGLHAGANDYVSKPIDKAEFMARVKTLLNLKQIHVLRQQRDKATIEASENLKLALHHEKHDALTGLPNRNTMKLKLRQALQQADNKNQSLALLFVGLDKFGQINERFGHERGDFVLKEISDRLRRSLRDSDTIVRFESDTFVIGVYELDRERDIEGVKKLIDNILLQVKRNISLPLTIGSNLVSLSASIGVSIYPYGSSSVNELFRHADIALHHAKLGQRGGCEYFSEELYKKNTDRFEIESFLRQALARNEFKLVYQPQVLIGTQQVIGAEALIRWQHPKLGFVSPAEFIPIAEDTGIINEIGQWVINQACIDISRWRKNGINFGKVAVNLSAHQFNDKSLAHYIQSCINKHHLDCADLELEITEGILINNVEKTKSLLNQFKNMGHPLSIDDFGTGYSSLSYLKQFPINTLKIDQSFIKDLPDDTQSIAIVKSIIDLAKGLGLEVIAEGVETSQQWHCLEGLGCDQIQGYIISKPVAFQEFDYVSFANKKLKAAI